MSFYEVYSQYKNLDLEKEFEGISSADISDSLDLDVLEIHHLIALLSPQAENHLEAMAQKAHAITLRYFGKTIQLYTPMYLSNYCDNYCLYCGFNKQNKAERKKLTLGEVGEEARFIAETGLKHILILTGESKQMSPVSYIKECVGILKKYFSSIAIEIYPLSEEEYRELVAAGVDGLTIYQETYDEEIYGKMHLSGPKKDYCFRLNAPERGGNAHMHNVNIGVLLGLNDWRRDVFFLGMHAKYLQDKFSDVEIGISVPRIRPQAGNFRALYPVSDKHIVQIILALRLFLPRLSISISTREGSLFRENLIPLGITRLSAGSTTIVGGHTLGNEDGKCKMEDGRNPEQFEISDKRSVEEIKAMLEKRGYQPVLKDWMHI